MTLNTGWDYLNAAFAGADLTEEQMANYSPFFMNRLLSFDPEFRKVAHAVNRWYFIEDKLRHYRMVMGHLAGKRRYIKYAKKVEKKEVGKAWEMLAEGCRQLFGWSRREFGENLWWMKPDSQDFKDLCSAVGLSPKETEALAGDL